MKDIRDRVLRILQRVNKPGRYIGGEINSIYKEPGNITISMAICYPDIYEIGMSNLGIRIIYEAVNRVDRYSCERVFAPWPDFEKLLKEYQIPLYTLESFKPLYEFDVIGFSIGYELLYPGVLNVLELGKIPMLSRERGDSDPIIIAGGPGIYNPEPGADFIDVFVFGDGESSILEILRILEERKDAPRKEKLKALDKLSYTYVPILYPVTHERGYLYTTVEKDVKRKIEPELDALPFPKKPIVPLIRIVQDRITLEVDRGCVNGCRFCQAGYIYRPARERDVESLLEVAKKSIKNSGYDEVALSSLSIADYSELERLSTILEREFTPQYVSLSLPSLRVNSVNLSLFQRVQRVRKSGLTFAVETPDEKARAGLNKIVSEDHIEFLVKEAKKLGWRLIKLYFMIGIPGVENEDEKIATFIRDLQKAEPGLSINVNVSVFVPKPHTPLEREEQISPERAQELISRIKKLVSTRRVRIKYTSPKMSCIEGVLSRGDRALCGVIYDVYKMGERLTTWEEYFNYDRWMESFSKNQVDPFKYLNYRDESIRLPWYFIDTGLNKDFKKEEVRRFYDREYLESCRHGKCSYCGVCGGVIRNILSSEKKTVVKDLDASVLSKKGKSSDFSYGVTGKSEENRVIKIVFVYTKLGPYKFLSQLDMQNLFIRIGRIAEFPFKYTEGFNPRPRINLPYAIPVGVESEYELGEIILTRKIDPDVFVRKYNGEFERLLQYSGIRIVRAGASDVKKTVFSEIFFHDYLIEGDIGDFVKNAELFLHRVDKLDEIPKEIFNCENNRLFVRLGYRTSIKKILDGEWQNRDIRITRKMIWGMKGEELYRYL